MTSNPVNWHEDVALDPAKEYRALLRSLRWTEGFGVLFVQCSPAEGSDLVKRVRQDLAGKTIEVLTLNAEDTNLFDCVEALPNKDDIDVLFVQGLEQSIYAYERSRAWETPSQAYTYSEASVPRLLSHLNLNRELFYKQFKVFFVFLVPLFVLKYVSRRAPDFFDWRSGVLEFPADVETAEREYQRLFFSGHYIKYLTWTQSERNRKILELQAWLEEPEITLDRRANLLQQQALLFNASEEHKEAIASYDQALKIKPDDHEAWNNRGNSLDALGRKEEAIASYDQALKIKPDDHEAWNNRGVSLDALGRKEEAIASYDQALKIKPDKHEAWNNRGNSLYALGRKEEAIASYDQALKIKPDLHEAWSNRGVSLSALGRNEEAIASYDQALEIKPDYHEAWYNRGVSLSALGRNEEAIASYDQALKFKPDYAPAFFNKACCYGLQNQVEPAIDCLQRAIELDPKCKDWAKTNTDFDLIRESDRFQALVGEGDTL